METIDKTADETTTDATLEPATVIIDGYVTDAETGEVLGCVDLKPQFMVTDMASAEWALAKILHADSKVAEIATSAAVREARAIIANAEAMEKAARQRAEWLRKRFEAELGMFARQELEGARSKTLKTQFGSISLRTKRGAVRIEDEESAIKWARENCPDAIKVKESFLISVVDVVTKTKIQTLCEEHNSGTIDELTPEEGLILEAFRFDPETETVAIVSGV